MKKTTRRMIAVITVMMFSLIFFALPVSADSGPKETLDLTIENPPDEEYYIDLLYKDWKIPNYEYDVNEIDPDLISDLISQGYDPEMTELLFGCYEDGYLPRLGDWSFNGNVEIQKSNSEHKYHYGYLFVLDNFKIIIVTKSGKVIVSDEIHKEAFYSQITYDVKNNQWWESNAEDILYTIKEFLFTLIITVVIEGILLIFFSVGEIDSGIQAVKNITLFLAVNIVTQIFLYLCLCFIGSESYLWVEAAILVIESLAYFLFFTPKHRVKFIIYAIIANICSFIAGFYLIYLDWDFLFK